MTINILMLRCGIASLVFLSSCNAVAQKVVLKADGAPATLTISYDRQKSGGGKKISYTLIIDAADCTLRAGGVAQFYRASDGMTDSAYLPDGDNVKTNQFIDNNSIGDIVITLDIESRTPKYANVRAIDAAHKTDGCFKAEYGSYEFYRK